MNFDFKIYHIVLCYSCIKVKRFMHLWGYQIWCHRLTPSCIICLRQFSASFVKKVEEILLDLQYTQLKISYSVKNNNFLAMFTPNLYFKCALCVCKISSISNIFRQKSQILKIIYKFCKLAKFPFDCRIALHVSVASL